MQCKKIEIFDFIVLFTGILGTMPIVEFDFGGRYISGFRVFLLLVLIMLFLENRFAICLKTSLYLVIWLIIGLASCIAGYITFIGMREWQLASISNFVKIVVYLLLVILWAGQKDIDKSNYFLGMGLFIGSVANIAWAIVDAMGFYAVGYSISNTLFRGYIERHNIQYGVVSLIYPTGMIRSAGFNYDPAHLGFIIPFVFGIAVQQKKYLLLILCGLGMIASASTTSVVCSIFVFFTIRKGVFENKNVNSKDVFVILGGIVGCVIVGANSQTRRLVESALHLFTNRVSSVYMNSNIENVRLNYLKYIPQVISDNLSKLLVGTGYGTASYGYVTNKLIRAKMQLDIFPYDMENTYIAYLLDTGIVGFTIFILLIAKIGKWAWHNRKNEKMIKNIICCGIYASLFSMVFYHYILFVPQILLLLIAVTNIDSENMSQKRFK